jgi:two-component system, response regulator PdtaR
MIRNQRRIKRDVGPGSLSSSRGSTYSGSLVQMDPREISILIGEEDEVVALDMQKQLCKVGYKVEIRTGTPEQVVVWARERNPSLIVLDLNIKGDLSGIPLAREIHRIVNIPIVFVSAYAKDVLENDPAIPRPYRYITKPFVMSELHTAIQDLLAHTP